MLTRSSFLPDYDITRLSHISVANSIFAAADTSSRVHGNGTICKQTLLSAVGKLEHGDHCAGWREIQMFGARVPLLITN